MTTLTIETYSRGEGHLAIALTAGELLSTAGVGGGDTEREAIQQAVNSYFNRREPTELQLGPPSPLVMASAAPGAGSLLGCPARMTTFVGICNLLREALRQDLKPRLTMTYTDAENNTTERDIIPAELKPWRPRAGFEEDRYLVAIDCEKDEPRTFRLDRIKALETT